MVTWWIWPWFVPSGGGAPPPELLSSAAAPEMQSIPCGGGEPERDKNHLFKTAGGAAGPDNKERPIPAHLTHLRAGPVR
jgi:hypothetical protein